METTLVLIARPAAHGRLEASLDGEPIATSRQPLLAGARALLRLGYDPATLVSIRPFDRPYLSFRPMPIGQLAKLTITERERDGLKIEPWCPFEGRAKYTPSGPGST